MSLFRREDVIGTFRGFSEGGMEFHADLVFPYRADFQTIPMHGQFVIVQLEHENEAVLGRITTIASEGRLVSSAGEDYAVRAVREERPIPDDLRDQYLKYRVNIRILGVLRNEQGTLNFVASHRRLPHVGARVGFLSPNLLRHVAGANRSEDGAAELGFLAYGEFVYAAGDHRMLPQPGFQILAPAVVPRFPVRQLVSRRSFVFARAGFGKSNLIKLLFAKLYEVDPVTPGRTGDVPVGTIIFDPDGEYYWPDVKGRPALCDVPTLLDRLVVFTNKRNRSQYYQSFVAGGVKLDIRQLQPAKVLSIVLPADKQDQQNVQKIKGLSMDKWATLIDAVYQNKHSTDEELIRTTLGLNKGEDVQMLAARANMVRVVAALHDPSSQLLEALKAALTEGKLCVVDISQMRGPQGLSLAGILLEHIFDHNQDEFTKAAPRTIPTIAVIEEAQTVLAGVRGADDNPFVSWVKEGRKYDLGAVLVTQQPGSIPGEILSQGDNWFVFHLLASQDLTTLKRANAHFSDDLLSSLLNEPLVGHGVFWSSAGQQPYPLSVRTLSFEAAYPCQDPDYTNDAVDNYASRLKGRFQAALKTAAAVAGGEAAVEGGEVDVAETYRQGAIAQLRRNREFYDSANSEGGVRWGWVQRVLADAAPAEAIADPFQWAYGLVRRGLDECLGEGNWETYKPPTDDHSQAKVWVRVHTRVTPPAEALSPGNNPADA